MKKTNHIELLERFKKKQLTREEFNQLKEWFFSDFSGQELLSYYRQSWDETSNHSISPELQAKMYQDIKHRMRKDHPDKKSSFRQKSLFIYRALSYAAIFLLCISIGYSIYLYNRTTNTEIPHTFQQEYIVEAEKGQQATLTLPDGTKVWLNSHTEIKYSSDYGMSERFVQLKGEAYFEVARDTEKRFIVKAAEMEVEALGTSFSVKAYDEDSKIVTTLFTGKIRAAVPEKEMILEPRHYMAFNRNDQTVSSGITENTYQPAMWRNNEFDFQSQSLEEIALLLNRFYDVEVVFEVEHIRAYSFSGIIKNASLEKIIESITSTSSVICTRKGNMIMFRE